MEYRGYGFNCYDLQSNIIKKCVTDLESSTLYTFYYYDAAGRLIEVYTNIIDSQTGRFKEAEYTYNADGTVKRMQLANAQGMDYQYNERGWLTGINDINSIGNDKFAEEIQYNAGDLIQYNGNITAVKFYNKGISEEPHLGYRFSYDGVNRLTSAETFSGYSWNSTNSYKLPLMSYDANGNFNMLQRFGADGVMMDNFTYNYQPNSNKLNSIADAVTMQSYTYGYDNNGNLISDSFRGITNVTYNNRNLPEQLTSSGTSVNYWYDGAGNRIRKQYEDDDEIYVLGAGGETEAVFDTEGNAKFFNITTGAENLGRYEPILDELKLMNVVLNKKYTGNKIIVGPNVTVTGTAELKAGTSITLKPGFTAVAGCSLYAHIDPAAATLTRFYYLKDHLGSTRVTVNQDGSEIVSYDDYDPWGMQLDGRSGNLASAFDKFKFTGKERDVETGYDYFGARYYDSRIARWLQVDPLAEKYPGWSPYNYVLNNPMILTDTDGNGPWDFISKLANTFAIWVGQKVYETKQKIEENKSATVTLKVNGEMREYTAQDLVTNADINCSRGIENSLVKIEDISGKVGIAAKIATPILGAINPAAGATSLKFGVTADAVSTVTGMGKEAMKGNTDKLLLKMAISGGGQLTGTKIANFMAGLDPKNAALIEQTIKPVTELIIDGSDKVIRQELEKKKRENEK